MGVAARWPPPSPLLRTRPSLLARRRRRSPADAIAAAARPPDLLGHLLINQLINSNALPRQKEHPNSNGTLATFLLDHIWIRLDPRERAPP